MNKVIIFYHNKDLDGFCSAAIAKKSYHDFNHEFEDEQKEVQMIGWDYNDPLPDLDIFIDNVIVMVDISLPWEMMLAIRDQAFTFTWIDHHKTAIDLSVEKGYNDVSGIRRIGDSASLLAWEFWYSNTVLPEVVYWVDRYDVWKQWDNWETVLTFQFGLRARLKDPCNINNYIDWMDQISNLSGHIWDTGLVIYDFQKQQNEKQCKNAFDLEWMGYKFLALNHAFGGSTVVDSVITPQHDGVFMFCFNGEDYSVSLYGNGKNIDLSVIAKQYGGGGHANACGFRVTPYHLNSIFTGVMR